MWKKMTEDEKDEALKQLLLRTKPEVIGLESEVITGEKMKTEFENKVELLSKQLCRNMNRSEDCWKQYANDIRDALIKKEIEKLVDDENGLLLE